MAPISRLFNRLEDVDIKDMHTSLPLGPDTLKHGTLQNGVKYYVRPCSKPKGRAALALVVRIGSVVEEDHEQGIAHMVEHLAFNATDNYNNHAIVKFLESIGAEFGACQNAYTSADETVYQLLIPTEGEGGAGLDPDMSKLRYALNVLAEFAFCIRCDEAGVNRERGAVLEEWRMSRDASGRTQEAYWKLTMQGSRYADRLPIGKENIVRTVPAATIKAFYERWYRPEHMAVVVVGDVPDQERVLTFIKEAFELGKSRDTSPCPAIPDIHYVPHKEPRYQVFVDREVQATSVNLSFKHPRKALATPGEYLKHLENWLFENVLGTRLFKLSREQDPVFLSASAGEDSICRTTGVYCLSANALEGNATRALRAVLEEVARIRLHGISDQEFAHALLDAKKDVENTYKERDQSYCWDLRDEYVRHFTNNEFVTGQEYESRLSKTLLGQIKKEAVEAVAEMYRTTNSCVIKVVEHRKAVTEQELVAVVEQMQAAEVERRIPPLPAADILVEQLLPPNLPPAPAEEAAIVGTRQYERLGASEWRLSNGLTIVLKQTDFMDDQLLMSGIAIGGMSEVPRDLHYTAGCAPLVVGQLGKFGIKPTLLNDLLVGMHVDITTSEGAFNRQIGAEFSPADLEVGLQLVHRLFTTKMVVDEAELAVVLHMLHEHIRAQERNPVTKFHDRLRTVNYGDCPYFRPMDHKDLLQVDLQKACDHHNRSFQNPAEFKLVFTGNISAPDLLPLVLKYLATLPTKDDPPPRALRDVTPLEWQPPTSPVVQDVPVRMVAPITQSQLTFPITVTKDKGREEMVWLGLITRVLETRLMQRMRFVYGEIYTVSVGLFFGCEAPSWAGNPRGDMSIAFTCDPDNRHSLIDLALQEVEMLQEGGVTQQELDTVLNMERLQQAELEAENSYWHDTMVSSYQSRSFAQTGDIDEVYRRLTVAREKVWSEVSPDGVAAFTAVLCRMLPNPCRSCYTALSMVPQRNFLVGWAHSLLQLLRGPKRKQKCGLESNLESQPDTPTRRWRWGLAGMSAAALILTGCGVAWLSRSSKSSAKSASSGSSGSTNSSTSRR